MLYLLGWLLHATACTEHHQNQPLIGEVSIVTADQAGPALRQAELDFRTALEKVGDASLDPKMWVTTQIDHTLTDLLGESGYQFVREPDNVLVQAGTEVGAAYGLYALIQAMGVVYHHPEETFFPSRPQMVFPLPSFEVPERPDFELRGFHHHTQHPIVSSDDLLRPGMEGSSQRLTNQMIWLLRNRQNVWSFHGLNTLDLQSWLPHLAEVVDEAKKYGVSLGMALSFADQQQHNYKLINALGDNEEQQIADGLDLLLATGLSFLTFQIGTSEFTQPPAGSVVRWLDFSANHMAENFPDADAYTWVHITCDLETVSGENFFHQSLQSDPRVGAWVHTTMFYTLTDPAPVYDCAHFRHQLDYLSAADGQRMQVFFPETAWWLGFDNNVPLSMPITGISRERDIQRILMDHDVMGHITFTTGREWLYWSYDHYLTRSTWDGDYTWRQYLQSIAPIYGVHGQRVAEALEAWTALQVRYIYNENPHIHFYLAGELPQDEAGARAGIIARPPKLALETVMNFGEADYARWLVDDFELLEEMRTEFGRLLAGLPPVESPPKTLSERLYHELFTTLALYVLRIDHAIAIYGGVRAARAGDEAGARIHHTEAESISERAIAYVASQESYYRYPLDLLVDEKPASLTAYPFGYLHETRTGFFWTRRDDQLARLLEATFSPPLEEWSLQSSEIFVARAADLVLIEPVTSVAAEPLKAFIPSFLFALGPWGNQAGFTLLMAQDGNENNAPDFQTEITLTSVTSDPWRANFRVYPVRVTGTGGGGLGVLNLYEGRLEGSLRQDGEKPSALDTLRLSVRIDTREVINLIRSIAGIDEVGLGILIKSIFGLDTRAPLPERLPLVLDLPTRAVSTAQMDPTSGPHRSDP